MTPRGLARSRLICESPVAWAVYLRTSWGEPSSDALSKKLRKTDALGDPSAALVSRMSSIIRASASMSATISPSVSVE